MVPAGTPISFQIAGDTGQWLPRTVADVRKDALDALSPDFDVITLAIVRTASLTDDPLNLYYWEWPYTATLDASPRSDYGDIRDVDQVVAHAFYLGAGQVPTVTAPGYGEPTDTNPESQPPGVTGLFRLAVVGLIAVAVIMFANTVRR